MFALLDNSGKINHRQKGSNAKETFLDLLPTPLLKTLHNSVVGIKTKQHFIPCVILNLMIQTIM